jgi:hypothetical protein
VGLFLSHQQLQLKHNYNYTHNHTHIYIHIPASLQHQKCCVHSQRRTQVPRACSTNIVETKAGNVEVTVSIGQGRGAPSSPQRLQHTRTASSNIHIHIHRAPLQRRQRRVDLKRRAQVTRACIANVVAKKAGHVQV